jgi:hypothetical protein
MEFLERISFYFISHTRGKITKKYVAAPERGRRKKVEGRRKKIRLKIIFEDRATED